MIFKGLKVGFALTGAFGAYETTILQLSKLVELGVDVVPIMSFNAYTLDTKFGTATEYINRIRKITGKEIIHTIVESEKIGQQIQIDILVIAPCTGNTIAKIANDITDTPVTMAAKSHLINGNSIVLGIFTNNGLGANATNIGMLLNSKNIFFIPFRQNNPITKPNSLTFDKKYIIPTIEKALIKEQIQPLLL